MCPVFCICIFSLLCVVAKSNKCKTIRDHQTTKEFGMTREALVKDLEGIINVRNNIDEFVAKIRARLKNDNLPPGAVKYHLFTSEKLENHYTLTKNKGSFDKVPYNNKKPLAFGIHGMIQEHTLTQYLMGDLIKSVVALNKYNVIFADYSMLGNFVIDTEKSPFFLAAKDMARFLQLLMGETGTKVEQIHVIGLSLGGQLAGIVGHFLPNIGRITALDPGGTFFEDFPKDLRLDRSDAQFVDVIHTCDGRPFPKGWGYYKPCGHLDFYPNGGLYQPGCNSTIPEDQVPTTLKEAGSRLCMHDRSAIYYMESTCDNCTFTGIICESYERFQRGLCTASNSMTAVMGEFATKPSMDLPKDTMFFLNTNDHYPFCHPQKRLNPVSRAFYT